MKNIHLSHRRKAGSLAPGNKRNGRMAGKTLYDKLWEMHEVSRRDDGSSLLYIDRHILHEVTSPQAFEGLRLAGRRPWPGAPHKPPPPPHQPPPRPPGTPQTQTRACIPPAGHASPGFDRSRRWATFPKP